MAVPRVQARRQKHKIAIHIIAQVSLVVMQCRIGSFLVITFDFNFSNKSSTQNLSRTTQIFDFFKSLTLVAVTRQCSY